MHPKLSIINLLSVFENCLHRGRCFRRNSLLLMCTQYSYGANTVCHFDIVLRMCASVPTKGGGGGGGGGGTACGRCQCTNEGILMSRTDSGGWRQVWNSNRKW